MNMIYANTARFDTGRTLTEDEMRKLAPSIFATEAHSSRSDRFAPIPSHIWPWQAFLFVVGSRDVAHREAAIMTIEHEMRALMAQTVLPGAEKATDAAMAQRGTDAPLRPKTPQRLSCDGLPLFGDSHKQLDLIDAIRGLK